MGLVKQTVTGQIEIGELGTIGLRTDTIVLDGGVEISRNFHRKVLAPNDDVSGEDAKVQAVAKAVWTDEVVAAYVASQAAAAPAAEEAPAE
mgnify:CR=1 FL=1|tara:strand:+ start:1459 stop:1731 length:273 start_codon:yes stop_codon:yes gene_type:complete